MRRVLSVIALFLLISTAMADDKEDIALVDKLKSDPFAQFERTDAMKRLMNSGTKEGAEKLIDVLNDEFVHMRDVSQDLLVNMKGDHVGPALLKALSTGKTPEIRRRCAETLGLRGAQDAVQALSDGMKRDKDIIVREGCARALGYIGNDDCKKALSDILKAGGSVAGVAARALGQLGEKDAADKIEKLVSNKDWVCAVGALDGLAALGPDGFIKTIAKAAESKDHRVAIAAAQCLARVTDQAVMGEVRAPFQKLLASKDWRIRRRTIEALIDFWQPMSCELLIERFTKEEGALIYDIVHALEDISGQRKGYTVEGWKFWWDTMGSKSSFPARKQRPAFGWLRSPSKEGVEEAGKGATTVFFKVPVLKRDSAFVFDPSGSMRDPVSKKDTRSKIDVARAELEKTLTNMPKGTFFNIVMYKYPSVYPPKTDVVRAFKECVEANPANTKQAIDWMAKQEIKGWGAFYEAIAAACEDPKIQCIYFLSDGAPSRGAAVDDRALERALREHSRFYPITLNTVFVGTKFSDERVMKNMAEQNSGVAIKAEFEQ